MKKIFVTFLAFILIVCCVVGLAACDRGGDDVIEATGIALDETEITLKEGEDETLIATITP